MSAPTLPELLSRRHLRLGSGLVMFVYVATHFVDHALGLISLRVAERALELSVQVWHSPAGTALLYGAVAVHVALALLAVYDRRTLRMPPMHAVRMVLGFGMPILLIGHVIATRGAAELHGLSPTYTRIVWALWLADSEGRQLALQAPGWVHGCLGLQIAFGHRAGWQRARPVLFGAALLLPVLAALGFLAMGRELAAMSADPAWLAAQPKPTVATLLAIGGLRDQVLYAYFGLIAAAFAARELRGWVERQRRLLVPVAYPHRTVDIPRGWSVLEASRSFGIPHLSVCGGQSRCSTCRVRVVDGAADLPPPGPQEQRTLQRIHAAPDVRLACQLRPTARVVLEPLLDPSVPLGAGPATEGAIVERKLALLFVKVAAWVSPRGVHAPPHDLVYAHNRVLAVVGQAVQAAGGQPGSHDHDGAGAVFGHDSDLATALRRAWQAAAAIERDLLVLNERLLRELGIEARFAIALHAGTAAIGPLHWRGLQARLPVGPAVCDATALRDLAAAQGARLAISRAVLAASPWNAGQLAWQRLPGPEYDSAPPIDAALLPRVRPDAPLSAA